MDISEIVGLTSTTAPGQTYGNAAKDLGKSEFLMLLVTQLQNQDPFEPVDNAEFVSQLAQFTTLEQSENMNSTLETLALIQGESYRLQSLSEGSALIGKEVVYYDPKTGGTSSGIVDSLDMTYGIVTLKIGDQQVLLSDLVEVREPAEE